MKPIAVALAALFVSHLAAASESKCANDAAEQAQKLLVYHLGAVGAELRDQMGFEAPNAKPSMKNPANPKQKFNVLEVIGFVSPHGEYRMRFIYFETPRGCLLMGEEILEFASL